MDRWGVILAFVGLKVSKFWVDVCRCSRHRRSRLTLLKSLEEDCSIAFTILTKDQVGGVKFRAGLFHMLALFNHCHNRDSFPRSLRGSYK